MNEDHWSLAARLADHMESCDRRHIDMLNKLDRFHAENKESIAGLYRAGWYVATAIIGGLFFLVYSLLHNRGVL